MEGADKKTEDLKVKFIKARDKEASNSKTFKESEAWRACITASETRSSSLGKSSSVAYDEYLVAMKRAHHEKLQIPSPRSRRRARRSSVVAFTPELLSSKSVDFMHITTIASMVPDEIIYNHAERSMRCYESALMFIDVSGFTELCEAYTIQGRGGPSKITEDLNFYIGAMVQEILTHNGDVLKFAGDAFLSLWKKTDKLTMQDVVHTAIDCGLIIQKNYGTHVTDLGITLKVKVAISAGLCHIAIIGGASMSSYVIVGQPVWDVKAAEYVSTAGDVLTSASAWDYVNKAEYYTQPCGDGRHTKVLGIGVTWKRVEKIGFEALFERFGQAEYLDQITSVYEHEQSLRNSLFLEEEDENKKLYREYTLRPAVIEALRSSWWPALRRFMVTPVLRAVDNDEPLEFLTEVRHVVIIFVNIITKTVTEDVLIDIVDRAYKHVFQVTSESGGLVNKVSMFDKDMMFLVVFGLRGLKHEDEAKMALLCAFQLKETLKDPDITSVSIGVTSGRTYCGVVGHVLRREYTVIGASVNKAARLMMAYENKVTCDKETFVRGKLDLDFFRLMEIKYLKGIPNPGPIYEFNQSGWPDRTLYVRHPILGRNEEMRRFKEVLQNAITHRFENFTRYRDFRYGIIILGPKLVGKKRLLDEFLHITPSTMRPVKINMTLSDLEPFAFIRKFMKSIFGMNVEQNISFTLIRDIYEARIRSCLGARHLSSLQIFAVNTIFDVHFPLPENFKFTGDILNEPGVKELLLDMFTNMGLKDIRVIGVKDGQYIDDLSWRCLILIMDSKSIFIIIAIDDHETLSPIAKRCLSNHLFVRMNLQGIDRWYHAALACQLLDVQAIPADLEKVIESASEGIPGWIQNFLISLIQRRELMVVTVTRNEATEVDAVMPCSALLYRAEDETPDIDLISWPQPMPSQTCKDSTSSAGNEIMQMAVLAENYNFDDMKVDMTMDVIILKMYDSLTPFEKMLLKCGSVLGDVFSRQMLLHLLQSDSQRKVALAVAKLFELRVLECEGGDFSRNNSMVLIHPAPPMPSAKPPYCSCLGTVAPTHCKDLPMYAFCGYMKFNHALFRTTTYELLTENQKLEMHGRALLFLERYTRRCSSCGSGCFIRLFGLRSDDGLTYESLQLRRVRQQIAALSTETSMKTQGPTDEQNLTIDKIRTKASLEAEALQAEPTRRTNRSTCSSHRPRIGTVRSFSSLEFDKCECLPILLSVYIQAIDHCKAVGDCEKLFETYIEYMEISLTNMNIPQVIRLLMDVELHFINPAHQKECKVAICKIPWVKDYRMARIATLRGSCMLESGEYDEARTHLFSALKLFGCPFPKHKWTTTLQNKHVSFQQFLSIEILRSRNAGKITGWVGRFYEHVGIAYNTIYKLFEACKEYKQATLAAKKALHFIRKSNNNFRLLCLSYANMITVYRKAQQYAKCLKLKKLALDICNRKRGQLDVTEIYPVSCLYTSLFLLDMESGKRVESLDFGMSVIPLMCSLPDITVGQILVLWILKLLLVDLRVKEMVMIMREFFYMTDHYDLSSETWYYYYSIIILLDTGYCVEHYSSCEKFYIRKGDGILRSRTPEAAWNFFVVMWLVTVRSGAWERSILWEEKIKGIMDMTFCRSEYMIMLLLRLTEGMIISYVNEVNHRNVKKAMKLDQKINNLFEHIEANMIVAPAYKPRYCLLKAHYYFIKGKKKSAQHKLKEALKLSKKYDIKSVKIWIAHTESHWKGTLDPSLVNYWVEHIEVDTLLDYKDFNDNVTIVPFTLPLPIDKYNRVV